MRSYILGIILIMSAVCCSCTNSRYVLESDGFKDYVQCQVGKNKFVKFNTSTGETSLLEFDYRDFSNDLKDESDNDYKMTETVIVGEPILDSSEETMYTGRLSLIINKRYGKMYFIIFDNDSGVTDYIKYWKNGYEVKVEE